MKPIFAPSSDDYLYTPVGCIAGLEASDLYLPLEVDTEFFQPLYSPKTRERLNLTITIQYRSIYERTGLIYSHPDISHLNPRHKLATYLCTAGDYLVDMGYDVQMYREVDAGNLYNLPTLTVDFYTFFAVAELYRMFLGDYIADIDYICVNKNSKSGIDQARRLRTFTKHGSHYLDYVFMPWIWDICGIKYKIALRFFDTSAVHGVANYASFCSNSGVQLSYKDVFSKEDKENMLSVYFMRPNDFDNYALGDLYNHPALVGNSDNFKKIYDSLGISTYYTLPRLTVGSTIARMIEGCIKNLFKVSPKDRTIINTFCFFASSEYIKNLVGTTAALNAKVDGGRCRNNRPLQTFISGVICDNDISGCYGEGLRAQLYPFGRPLIIDYPSDSERNAFMTLRQFLSTYGEELVPGLWQARICTKLDVTLKYPQDILVSWMPPKDIRKLPTDSEFQQTDEWWSIENTGETKIFRHEIRYAIITHDFIQWLENVATARQRNDFLDNTVIVTAALYPASERIDSIEELLSSYSKHEGRNTVNLNKEGSNITKVSIERECYKWYATNLGDLLINILLLERKKYPKGSSFNTLYKLCVNTVFGDMVSPYFKVGNVVVGNNITARARTLAWYMEKGFFGVQTITDGCQFDLNKVAYPVDKNRRLTGENTVDLYAYSPRDRQIILQPLSYKDEIPLEWELQVIKDKSRLIVVFPDRKVYLSPKKSLKVVAEETFKHLQNMFPLVDILHQSSTDVYGKSRIGQFSFEVKNFYNIGTFHGTANYSLKLRTDENNHYSVYAMRSYSRHNHHKLGKLNDKLEIISTDYQPSVDFLDGLENPSNLNRSQVFIRRKILKIGDYRRNNVKWKETLLHPGMTIESSSLLREFSLTQFTYNSYQQYDSWRSEYQRLMKKYGHSYEMFFISQDGKLDYQKMIKTIDEKIRSGNNSFFDGIDKRKNNTYRLQIPHENLDILHETMNDLFNRYQMKESVNMIENEEMFFGDSDLD